ncbi:hypothetical protein KSAC_32280 (plasmid) [Komagataeibacter saccharivorans]|uniref:peroxidase-related enzyme n=1 Tax=Komagataeibacter saccharivorans TaxID=265959 RepID=UPI0010442B32|nr:peroxidase-related enzyme [Komagataeibacter saccharivorans]QBL95407.1 hypothetical protein KSAC_32280 [Komagataeibacter saccharivorans]
MLPRIRIRPLQWEPHLEPVRLEEASAAQLEAMKVTPSSTRISPYVRTLAHDPESYRARTELFNSIMYARDGIPRTERELGALAASVTNGCRYCAMIHGRRLAELMKSDDVITALWHNRPDLLSAREQAIWAFSCALSRTPPAATGAHVSALRRAGLSDGDILDLIHVIAIFGWANRLMHPLGRAVPGGARS